MRHRTISHPHLPSLATDSLRLVWGQNRCPLSPCLIPTPQEHPTRDPLKALPPTEPPPKFQLVSPRILGKWCPKLWNSYHSFVLIGSGGEFPPNESILFLIVSELSHFLRNPRREPCTARGSFTE